MKIPLLSICIPTYNREKYLKGAIESVLSQADEKNRGLIEICISDNCSADNTEKLVKKFAKTAPPVPIRYSKNSKNLGADMNFFKVVKMAKGEYCWFLSSDDELEKGAINLAIQKIKENPEIGLFVLNNQTYDRSLKKKIFGNTSLYDKYKKDYYFKNPFEASKNVTFSLGFLSIMLFKRKDWDKVKDYHEFIGSDYVLVYILLCAIRDGAKVMFNSDKLVKYRFGNDSFLDEVGVYKRHELDVKGFYNISAKVFGEYSKEHKAIINAFFDSHVNMKMIGGIKLKKDRELTKKMNALLFRYYKKFPKFWITVVPFMLIPTFVYALAAKTCYKNFYQKQYLK